MDQIPTEGNGKRQTVKVLIMRSSLKKIALPLNQIPVKLKHLDILKTLSILKTRKRLMEFSLMTGEIIKSYSLLMMMKQRV